MTKNESLQKLKDLENSLDDPEVMGRLDKIIDRYMSIAEEIEKKLDLKSIKTGCIRHFSIRKVYVTKLIATI